MGIKTRLAQVGATGALVIAGAFIYPHEGEVKYTYLDPVRVLTACIGHTGPELKLGQTFTEAQCAALFMADLQEAQAGIYQCLPLVVLPEYTEAALISFVLNVGKGALCKSTLAKKARQGDLVGACNELPRWVYAKGIKLPGLVTRRAAEKAMCLRGLNVS